MRLHDWPERLHSALDRIALEPMELGRSDCFTLYQDVVESLTGTRPFADELGRYSTQGGALRRLKANGFDDLKALVSSLGDELHPAFAWRGDIGIASGADGSPGVVVFDGRAWLGRGETIGLVAIPMSSVLSAYRIG